MKFQRHLLTNRPFSRGYQAPNLEAKNQHPALFQIGGKARGGSIVDEGLPERIAVQAIISPFFYRPPQPVSLTVDIQGQKLLPYDLYQREKQAEDRPLEAIEVHFMRFLGTDINSQYVDQPPNILYRKTFLVQTGPLLRVSYQIVDKKLLIVPPGIGGKQVLWNYGGYYRSGCELREIEQILFTPGREQTQANVQFSRISNWHTRLQECLFIEPLELTNRLSLAGDIENGKAELRWLLGIDENSTPHFTTYKSFAFYKNDPLSDLIKIDFQREQ